jgi:hypothetical protein
MTGKRRSDRPFRAANRRIATVFAALLAVFLQAFVVQTHIHASPFAPINLSFERSVDASGGDTQVSAAGDHQRFCAICQALAAAGAATLPSGASLISTDSAGEQAILALTLAPHAHTHSWQSRAPPSFL